LIFYTGVGDIHVVVKAFDVVMHVGSGRGGLITILFPVGLDLFAGHAEIFVSGVFHFATAKHVIDDGVCIEFFEMMVVPGSDGGISLFSMDGIHVRPFVECDKFVARVCVLLC